MKAWIGLRALIAMSALFAVSGCQTVDGTEQIGGETVRVGHGADGSVTRQFRLADGTGLNVVSRGGQATVMYVRGAPVTPAEIAGYVRAATGCEPGAALESYATRYNGALNTVYPLSCPQ